MKKKKFFAFLSMVALCGTMVVPVEAMAAPKQPGVCLYHDYGRVINVRRTLVDAKSHPYSYYQYDEDGDLEVVVGSCTIRIYQSYCNLGCNYCDAVLENQYLGKEEVHSKASKCGAAVG